MCHIYGTCLRCCQCRILFHKKHSHFLHSRCFSIIIRICFKDDLLSFIPLFHDITTRTDWILSIIFIISVFRYDSNNRHGIRPDCKRCVHMKLNSCIIYCHRFFEHGKIIYGTVVTAIIVCKCNILCRQWFAICKLHIITDFHSPGKPILTD